MYIISFIEDNIIGEQYHFYNYADWVKAFIKILDEDDVDGPEQESIIDNGDYTLSDGRVVCMSISEDFEEE